MTSCYLSTSELTLYWWCTVVSPTSKYDGPDVENVTRGRSLSATFSTEGHHIWMSREPPCFICFVVWPSSSLKYDFFVNFYRAMLCIRGTSHGPVSVCPSQVVTSRCSIETAERIELVFGMWASFHPFYTVIKGNSVISKNKGTSLWNFVLNFGLRKFRHGIWIVETCYQLNSRKVDAQSVINRAVVGQLSR